MFESNATETDARKITLGLPDGFEKVMVAKFAEEQPSWFRHNPEFSPLPRSKAVILGYRITGKRLFVKARIKNLNDEGTITTIGGEHFRTATKDKMRERLLPLSKTNPRVLDVLKTL